MVLTIQGVGVDLSLIRDAGYSRFYGVRHKDAKKLQMHVILHGDDPIHDATRLIDILNREIRLGLDRGWPRGVLAKVPRDAKETPEIS